MTAVTYTLLALLWGAIVLLYLRYRAEARRRDRKEHSDELHMILAASREQEERLRAAFQTTPDAMCICDLATGRIIDVNEGYCRASGWAAIDAIGSTWLDLKIWPDHESRDEMFRQLNSTGAVNNFDTGFRRADGNVFPSLLSARTFNVGGRSYFLATSRDLTAQRRAEKVQNAIYRIAEKAGAPGSLEEMLATVHQIIGELMHAANFYIALHDEGKLHFPYFVDEVEPKPNHPNVGRGLTGYVLRTGEALVVTDGRSFGELVKSGEVESIGAPSLSWVGVPLKTQAGATMGVLVAQSHTPGILYTDREKEILQFVSSQIAQAIERKRAEDSLRANERRFRALIEHGQDGIMLLTVDSKVFFRSNSSARIMGYPLDLQPQNAISIHVHPDDQPRFAEHWRKVVASPNETLPITLRAKHADGSWRSLETDLINLLADPAVQGIVCNFRDVTQRKQIEAQLMAADRMVSIGTLAAGVAHEINNPLAYVIANLQLMADAPAGSPIEEPLKAAQDGSERVRQIVRDLKTFSRADEERVSAVDVHQVLDASANIAWNEIRHRARLVKEYGAEVPRVAGNEARLGQVILNLLVNAAQAMPAGDAERNEIRLRTRVDEKGVAIEVSDTGAGISEENRARLFNPFFSTKPIGVGTGLGLYICQQIVTSMGGSIEVDSEQGKGSTFRLMMPAAPASMQPVRKMDLPKPESIGRARILAVDDEPMIGRVIKYALPAHDVEEISSAVAALEKIRGGERYDLIICDLMMPQMTGMDFHAALKSEMPEQASRMIFLTGGAFTPHAHEFLDNVGAPRMDKPFEIKAMRALVDERLRTFQ
jgi:PAS domain S-box-containing protein